jgi:putative addiction module CopG family antidote
MTITLTPELEAIVTEQLATGQFASADEVIAFALKHTRQQYEELKALIAEGDADIQNGRVAPLDASASLGAIRAKRSQPLAPTGEALCEQ